MNKLFRGLTSLIILLALMTSSAIVLAQDETVADAPAMPFIGIRYWESDGGVLITGVISNTPAESANLQAGDVITAIDAVSVDVQSVRDVVRSREIGDTITLSINRGGAAIAADITMIALPENLFDNADYVIPLDLAALGLYVAQCEDKVLVVGALEGSQFADAGLQLYDRLLSVNGEPINSIGAADAAVADLSEGDEVALIILRDGEQLLIDGVAVDHRRRDPRHRPPRRRRPHIELSSSYATDSIGLGYGEGAIVIQSLKIDHPWFASGLRMNDVIREANGAPLAEAQDLFAGDSIALTVERADGSLQIDVPASTAPLLMFGLEAPASQDATHWLDLHEKKVTLGVRFIQLEADSPDLAGSGYSHGAYVAQVIEGLPAAAAGIQTGDVILAVDGEPATLEIDLRNRIYFHGPGDAVTLDVLRDGQLMQVEVVLRVAS